MNTQPVTLVRTTRQQPTLNQDMPRKRKSQLDFWDKWIDSGRPSIVLVRLGVIQNSLKEKAED